MRKYKIKITPELIGKTIYEILKLILLVIIFRITQHIFSDGGHPDFFWAISLFYFGCLMLKGSFK
jgi:hypothetical protein